MEVWISNHFFGGSQALGTLGPGWANISWRDPVTTWSSFYMGICESNKAEFLLGEGRWGKQGWKFVPCLEWTNHHTRLPNPGTIWKPWLFRITKAYTSTKINRWNLKITAFEKEHVPSKPSCLCCIYPYLVLSSPSSKTSLPQAITKVLNHIRKTGVICLKQISVQNNHPWCLMNGTWKQGPPGKGEPFSGSILRGKACLGQHLWCCQLLNLGEGRKRGVGWFPSI